MTTVRAPTAVESGPLLFARFAYPPNQLGYCGPADSKALWEHVQAGDGGPGLRRLAEQFAGAWPYLEVIAAANRIADPLDRRVVEAYWIGNGLLRHVEPYSFARHLEDRFHGQAGRHQDAIGTVAASGGVPHHSFHVLAVYPWVGLLRSGLVDPATHVLDQCRIRWGRVVSVSGDTAVVASRHLVWTGRLRLGPEEPETVRVAVGDIPARAADDGLAPGQSVALHWDWICTRLDPRQQASLEGWTARQLDLVDRLAPAAPATLLG